jgi:DNA-nicking Smr family endonuclease
MWPLKRRKSQTKEGRRPAADLGRISDALTDEPISQPSVVTDTLDLHGFFPEQIPHMIDDFIDNARRLGIRRLRIIHGKGKSRLKWEVYQSLKDHPEVESYGDAPLEAGGWGATMVLLRDAGEKT